MAQSRERGYWSGPCSPRRMNRQRGPSRLPKLSLTPHHSGGDEVVSILRPLPLALNDVKGFFTLSPKCFSSFVHTTCSLSDLVQYLAFGEVHLRISTALSNCTTLGSQTHPIQELPRRDRQIRDYNPPRWRFPSRFIHLPRAHVV